MNTKLHLLDQDPKPKRMKLQENADNEKFRNVISYLRYIAYSGPEDGLAKLKAGATKGDVAPFKAQNVPPLSAENEEKAMETLKLLCEQNLAKFPDPVERDVELLKAGGLTYNERNCILFRMSEKRVNLRTREE